MPADPRPDALSRAKALVARMTLDEKIGQMVHGAGAIPRLGIPAYNWWNEALHGVARAGIATVFPQSIGLAATFDTALVERVFSAVGDEGRAKHHAAARLGYRGIYAGLTFWTPNINIFRDPRWGRGQETYGECPFLTARMGVAVVRGLQGDDPRWLKVAACAKHFAVHSGPEAKRHGFDARVSLRDLRETYLPHFEALVREARVEAVMGAYNRTNGEPCCASPTLMGILRQEWGFQGHFVSDCAALDDFHNHHQVTPDPVASAALAVKQGCDVNCGSTYASVKLAVERGDLVEADLDACVTRLLATRVRLGLFDPPARVPYARLRPSVIDAPRHRRLALDAARASLVLVKNTGILPLPRTVPNLMVVGPGANDVDVLLGNYNGQNPQATTILQGIIALADKGTTVHYARGCGWTGTNTGGFGHAYHYLGESGVDTVIACVGLSGAVEGEEGDAAESDAGGDRVNIGLPGVQQQFLRELKDRGKRLVVVVTGGSPVASPWLMEHADAVLLAFYPGQAGGTAVAEALFGKSNPGGRLPFTVPTGLEQLPPFEDYAMRGRTYRFMEQEPLLPFGFGLSYTRFAYAKAKVPAKVAAGAAVPVSVTVRNTGTVAGDEVVQCYVRDLEASVPVPRRQLAAFARVRLRPGQSREVKLLIRPEQLRCFRDDGMPMIEPGEFEVSVGGGQPGLSRFGLAEPLTARFTVA